MGRLKGKRRFYNFIWTALLVVLLALLALSLVNAEGPVESLALEQEARCGFEEHRHTEECYLDGVLLCTQKAHAHTQNCYMLLLEDNDVNWLLRVISRMEDKSLRAVMDSALVQALELNPNFTSADMLLGLSGTDLGSLNQTIAENNIDPGVVLNEDLTGRAPVSEEVYLQANSSIGGTPVTNSGVANFYIWLDETDFLYIGNVSVTNNNSNDHATKADIASLFNTSPIISNITSSGIETGSDPDDGVQVRYTSTRPNVSTATGATFGSDANRVGSSGNNANRINFGNVISGSGGNRTYTPRYATLMTGSVNYYATYTPINFYTVTLDYSGTDSGKSSEVQYVQTGLNSTLSPNFDEYLWYTAKEGGTEVTSANVDDYLDSITGKTTLYARPKNRTVTFDSNGGTEVKSQTVKHGETATEPTAPTRENYIFGGWFADEECTAAYDFGSAVTENITLYAKWTGVPKKVTYNYYDSSGNLTKFETSEVPYGTKVGFAEGYVWQQEGVDEPHYVTGQTFTITEDTVFNGRIKTYTVTVTDHNGSTTQTTVEHGKSFTLGTLPTDDNWSWLEEDGSLHQSGETIYDITSDLTFTASTNVTAQFVGKNATTFTTVVPGTAITLPAVTSSNNVWVDEGGNIYAGNERLTLNENMVFTEKAKLTVSYDVNFSGALTNQQGSTVKPSSPTISGTSGTTDEVELTEGQRTTLHNVTPRMLTAATNQTDYKFDTAGYFVGWRTETGDILNPAESFSYEDLASYDKDGDGEVELTGVWESGWAHAANFCISFNSNTSGGEDRTKYTSSIYTSYVDVPDGYSLNKSNPHYGNDNQSQTAANNEIIMGLEGLSNSTDIGIYSIPSDQYVFEQLKALKQDGNQDLSQIKIDGESIPIEDLNSDTFAVRWYVVKYYPGDGWHVDGTLVRKTGNINITKTFEGRSSFVEAAQEGFTITAQAGSFDSDGEFVDNTSKEDITLVTSREASNSDTTTLGYDKVTKTENAELGTATVVYEWVIHDVKAGEIWNIAEKLVDVDDAVGMGEWVITDSSNLQSGSGIGTETQITGVTFPQDVASTEWLRADFTNVYHTENFLLIRKIDGLTRARLAGAKFRLWQKTQEDEKPMTFDLIEDGGQRKYQYNPAGTGAYTVLESDGTEIDIDVEEFSYHAGDVIIREVQAPDGYILADNEIRIGITGYEADGVTPIIDMKNDAEGYATFNQGLVVIENFADTMDVTAKKIWEACTPDEWADTVQVQLLANGSASEAASVLPAGVSTVATLKKMTDAGGDHYYSTHTWENLPVYIDGEVVSWSLKELMIGDEELKSDGTFPNWNAFPSVAADIVTDASGKMTATVSVTNRPKSGTELRLTKTDTEMTAQLPGATFEIADEDGNVLHTLTTDEYGVLVFPRLKYDTVYTITELEAPDGYWLCEEPIEVSIAENGTVEVDAGCGCAQAGNRSFSLVVTNRKIVPLPETGGSGTMIYKLGGLMLMLASAALIYSKQKKHLVYAGNDADTRFFVPTDTGRRLKPSESTVSPDEPVPRCREGPGEKEKTKASGPGGLPQGPPEWWPPTVKLRQAHILSPPPPTSRDSPTPHRKEDLDSS